MACEEAGKLSILIGAATRVVIDVPVDWKSTRKRFRSHDSKASQFMGLARGIPVIQEAVAAKGQVVDSKLMLAKAAAGAVVGPTLFTNRNASLYCDFLDGSFTSPNEQISEEMADQMIECAELHIDVANVTLGATAEEAAKRITERWSRQRYDSMMSQVSETADLMQMALSMLHTP
jgi:AbiV family abortive infection protein